jgi:hypothetical protein
VLKGTWCCISCGETAPVKCTGCKIKTGACADETPIVLDCPGPTTDSSGTVTCF